MSKLTSNLHYYRGLVSLYYLLIKADGEINDKERNMGDIMREHEGLSEEEFNGMINSVAAEDQAKVFKACIADLKACAEEEQVKCIAWMSLIANSDGFMDKAEWNVIYRIYYKELGLQLSDIMNKQKELPRFKRSSLSA
ncbi:MAG: TerB family tellurite resistance protein [Bacteroidota bacterium]